MPYSGTNIMFRGRSNHILDDKGRLAIPTRFREVLERKGDDCLVVTSKDRCLWAFAKEDWQKLEDKAANLPLFDEGAIPFLRGFISSAVECHVKNGRITLPPSLREDAGLQKEVVLAGQLKKFEIWDKERWEEEFARVKEALPTSPSLLELRI